MTGSLDMPIYSGERESGIPKCDSIILISVVVLACSLLPTVVCNYSSDANTVVAHSSETISAYLISSTRDFSATITSTLSSFSSVASGTNVSAEKISYATSRRVTSSQNPIRGTGGTNTTLNNSVRNSNLATRTSTPLKLLSPIIVNSSLVFYPSVNSTTLQPTAFLITSSTGSFINITVMGSNSVRIPTLQTALDNTLQTQSSNTGGNSFSTDPSDTSTYLDKTSTIDKTKHASISLRSDVNKSVVVRETKQLSTIPEETTSTILAYSVVNYIMSSSYTWNKPENRSSENYPTIDKPVPRAVNSSRKSNSALDRRNKTNVSITRMTSSQEAIAPSNTLFNQRTSNSSKQFDVSATDLFSEFIVSSTFLSETPQAKQTTAPKLRSTVIQNYIESSSDGGILRHSNSQSVLDKVTISKTDFKSRSVVAQYTAHSSLGLIDSSHYIPSDNQTISQFEVIISSTTKPSIVRDTIGRSILPSYSSSIASHIFSTKEYEVSQKASSKDVMKTRDVSREASQVTSFTALDKTHDRVSTTKPQMALTPLTTSDNQHTFIHGSKSDNLTPEKTFSTENIFISSGTPYISTIVSTLNRESNQRVNVTYQHLTQSTTRKEIKPTLTLIQTSTSQAISTQALASSASLASISRNATEKAEGSIPRSSSVDRSPYPFSVSFSEGSLLIKPSWTPISVFQSKSTEQVANQSQSLVVSDFHSTRTLDNILATQSTSSPVAQSRDSLAGTDSSSVILSVLYNKSITKTSLLTSNGTKVAISDLSFNISQSNTISDKIGNTIVSSALSRSANDSNSISTYGNKSKFTPKQTNTSSSVPLFATGSNPKLSPDATRISRSFSFISTSSVISKISNETRSLKSTIPIPSTTTGAWETSLVNFSSTLQSTPSILITPSLSTIVSSVHQILSDTSTLSKGSVDLTPSTTQSSLNGTLTSSSLTSQITTTILAFKSKSPGIVSMVSSLLHSSPEMSSAKNRSNLASSSSTSTLNAPLTSSILTSNTVYFDPQTLSKVSSIVSSSNLTLRSSRSSLSSPMTSTSRTSSTNATYSTIKKSSIIASNVSFTVSQAPSKLNHSDQFQSTLTIVPSQSFQSSSVSRVDRLVPTQFCYSATGERCVCYREQLMAPGNANVTLCTALVTETELEAVVVVQIETLVPSQKLENRTKTTIAKLVTEACNNGSYKCIQNGENNRKNITRVKSRSSASLPSNNSQMTVFKRSTAKPQQTNTPSTTVEDFLTSTVQTTKQLSVTARYSNVSQIQPANTSSAFRENHSIKFRKRRKRSLVTREHRSIWVTNNDVLIIKMSPVVRHNPAELAFFVKYRIGNSSDNETRLLEARILSYILVNNSEYLERALNVSIRGVVSWERQAVSSTIIMRTTSSTPFSKRTKATENPVSTPVGDWSSARSPDDDSKIMIVSIAVGVGCVLLLLIIIAIVIARINSKWQGEFVPDENMNGTISPDHNTQEMISSAVDPAPRITDVPFKSPKAKKTSKMQLDRFNTMTSEI